jgi:hypothetical protein
MPVRCAGLLNCMQGCPLLVLANKQDLSGALQAAALSSRLGVTRVIGPGRDYLVTACCAITKQGVKVCQVELTSALAEASGMPASPVLRALCLACCSVYGDRVQLSFMLTGGHHVAAAAQQEAEQKGEGIQMMGSWINLGKLFVFLSFQFSLFPLPCGLCVARCVQLCTSLVWHSSC